MTPDPVRLRQIVETGVKENFQFRDFLKRRTHLSSEAVDHLVFEMPLIGSDCAGEIPGIVLFLGFLAFRAPVRNG